ncbi:EscU/YscU/HrcU family type III secretion system export apparatus switch protein [Mobilicoccus pelagius]|uniref:Flagellar biosynthetic protein FlhB n=1 Tax=Mobilicoccus pelagius NBRC 104925 TaxID=1089455 RepID=H5UPK6_9MICO|nr:EscU/YscU/HrcU family type III secretion system export apparatus switch protein [Mobilicoccus pelagius]GAB47664.1 flagellar biosynthetic protein FlhB [Mobilicoccus pelagius NBRC 104925]
MADKSDKTEKATPQKKREAKQEGNLPKTQDLSMWLTVLMFVVLGPSTLTKTRDSFSEMMHGVAGIVADPELGRATLLFKTSLLGVLTLIGPLVLSCMIAGVLGHVVQGGIMPSGKRFKPKWKKLNPVGGVKNMFGMHGVWTLVKTLIKFVVFGLVAYNVVFAAITSIAGSGAWSVGAVLDVVLDSAMKVIRTIAVVGLVIAAADYAMERHRVEKSLRMSKDEIKRESKQQEGDPHIKGQRRARQREMGQRRMMSAVGEASVVMTNPSHVAVALKYETGAGAPQVVAKGSGHLAQRIRQEAEARDVPVVEDVIVARMLYKLCDVDEYIPFELYDAIAQVLAFVMHLSERGTAAGVHETPLHHPGFDGTLPDDLTDAALGIRTPAPATG